MDNSEAQRKSKRVSEARLWSWLSGNARKHYKHHLHMNRIENAIMAGMPDVEGCLAGTQFWMELKCTARPTNPTTHIKCRFQPQQIPWLHARTKAQGLAFVLLQVGSAHDAARYLLPAKNAGVLVHGLREDDLPLYSVNEKNASAVDIIKAAVNYAPF